MSYVARSWDAASPDMDWNPRQTPGLGTVYAMLPMNEWTTGIRVPTVYASNE
eukprot:NODE_15770_length_320_cov_2.738007_g14604_i0.p4 GENE.NODE_15770_length_320_cov_2.738007_g14604_i0~~NODE_15770_length_320_cov_2.738007_g14604_i0.p4  ORF type:complete len:52 (+),score=1.63 NODE_15770_length_320_cov_2.738007_g14604_i0:127-282(+)